VFVGGDKNRGHQIRRHAVNGGPFRRLRAHGVIGQRGDAFGLDHGFLRGHFHYRVLVQLQNQRQQQPEQGQQGKNQPHAEHGHL
jgi:hypothetical protein